MKLKLGWERVLSFSFSPLGSWIRTRSAFLLTAVSSTASKLVPPGNGVALCLSDVTISTPHPKGVWKLHCMVSGYYLFRYASYADSIRKLQLAHTHHLH